jgi:AmiR/NasT family two-component response regulator
MSSTASGQPDSVDEATIEALQAKVEELQQALNSRPVIEQAKGAISARCDVPIDIAFEILRGLARSNQRHIHDLAAEVVANGGRFSNLVPRSRTAA